MESREMSPEEAARKLDEKYRRYPWFISVGVGETPNGPALFVYVKTAKHPELKAISGGWMGFRVLIRAIGSIRPVSRTTSRPAIGRSDPPYVSDRVAHE
jgi:hypothetical protein